MTALRALHAAPDNADSRHASFTGLFPVADSAEVVLFPLPGRTLTSHAADVLSWRLIPAARVVIDEESPRDAAALREALEVRGITTDCTNEHDRIEGTANTRASEAIRSYGRVGLRGHVEPGARHDVYLKAGHLYPDDLTALVGRLASAGLVYIGGRPLAAVLSLRTALRAVGVQAETCPWSAT